MHGWGVGGIASILIATGPVFFFFTSQSVSAVYRDYEIENVKKTDVAVVNAAARREGEIWLDLSVRRTYV